MEVKLLEIRDKATFIPAMAVRLHSRDDAEFYLLRRAGYSEAQVQLEGVEPYIVLWRLEGGPAEYDPYSWGNRTMATAHQHIVDFWQRLESGDVVDVQYILGETKEAKKSERTL